ncbi:hypothetical protein X471_00442 [Bartonella bacilliformis str. Heidi Mejia]|uniref:hypothetical protein n=1 Tax=Bartonella bacilliformis TaxID=774 RepID=UPI0004478596|nr:hypothetical protein [Bartonella bacilliformis]EYS89768.1 hypothetical protein X472_00207 [Bartonella bacilliformis San Pedro600-02]EYS92150.1 hypothetical protein X471_00442 [Bartonella bacilliformis str. Heidi Mejia]EYS95110.1 hypothetical protein X470_00626 [Bartonella bacilliformis Peru-18]KEG16661.1 hypothetical protein H705_00535 [Bartonella bacilliformis Cond044]KEG17782.1 hypothetical protein H709_00518 [Bartonella bacilliformis CUSCO5]
MKYNTHSISLKKEKLLKQSSLLSLHLLRDAATKLAHLKYTPTMLSTYSLVNLLICQINRNYRSAIPPVRIHLRVASRTGNVPVKLRLGATNS